MAITAIREFVGVPKDSADRFHGKQIVYLGWERHLLFYAPICVALPPSMPFRALQEDVLPRCWNAHPDFARIDWQAARWLKDGKPFVPNLDASLADNAISHKSLLRLDTPGLDGIAGACI